MQYILELGIVMAVMGNMYQMSFLSVKILIEL